MGWADHVYWAAENNEAWLRVWDCISQVVQIVVDFAFYGDLSLSTDGACRVRIEKPVRQRALSAFYLGEVGLEKERGEREGGASRAHILAWRFLARDESSRNCSKVVFVSPLIVHSSPWRRD